jgi:hypothetical protein
MYIYKTVHIYEVFDKNNISYSMISCQYDIPYTNMYEKAKNPTGISKPMGFA